MSPNSGPGASERSADANSAALPDRAEQRKVLTGMVERGARLLGAARALVMMHRPGFGDFIALDCSYGATPAMLEMRVPLHQAPIGQVFAQGSPKILSDDECKVLQALYGVPVRNGLLTALESPQGEDASEMTRTGVFVALNKDEDFTVDDEMIFRRFARQISQGITYTELYAVASVAVAQYEAAIHSMRTGFLVINADGILYQTNNTMELIGISSADIGKHYEKAFEKLPPFLTQMIARVFETNQADVTELKLNVAAEGEEKDEREFRIQIDPVVSSSPGSARVHGAVMLMDDVTTLLQQKQAQESMVPVILHDMRTPLTPIQGNAQTLLEMAQEDFFDKELFVEFLETIILCAGRSVRLANDFLDIYRISAGHSLSISKKPFAIKPTLESLVKEQLAFLPPGARVTIELDCPDDIGEINADQGRVEQVILNFLSNATKYSPQGGTVTVKAERNGEAVRISVTDQGIGIPEEALGKMFQRYARVESERHKGIKGIGLGLFLSKEIVEAQQGTIGVESKYGEGSTFYFTLPVASG